MKERLVGAAVLVAAAVILIPEMLSGPKDTAPEEPAAQTADSGVRTYTIDLGNPARSGASETTGTAADIVAPAPPPEEVPEEPAPAAASTPAAAPAAPPSSPVPAERTASAPAVAPATPPAAPPVVEAPAAASRQADRPNLPWAVQVGSFANRATADRLSQDLKGRGYDSFVVPFRNGQQTLYRVRIGPMQQRDAADAVVQRLKREGTGATVVSN